MVDELIPSKLTQMYDNVLDSNTVLACVRMGKILFLEELAKHGIDSRFGNLSAVHSYDDVEVQAFILAMPSRERPQEMVTKAFMNYALHFIDDCFDRPDLEPSYETMVEHRQNIPRLLDSMGNVGRFGHTMAKKTRHPMGFYRGLSRLVYGALVQLASDAESQDKYLKEYKELFSRGHPQELVRDIKSLRDIVYWLTNKTAQDFWFAVENTYDPTLAELYGILFAPAIYFHDDKEEREKGELNFFGKQEPTIDEMVNMIKIAGKHIEIYNSPLILPKPLHTSQIFFRSQP